MNPVLSRQLCCLLLALAAATAVADDKQPKPMLFDPMAGPGSAAPASDAPVAPQDVQLFTAPAKSPGKGELNPGAAPTPAAGLPADPGLVPVSPGGKPVDAKDLMPPAPQVAPAAEPSAASRAAAGPHRSNQVTVYPPKVSAAPLSPAPTKGLGAGPSSGFTVDVVEPEAIDIQPGVDTIIPISRGHLNRIVTPFAHPKALTVSKATIDPRENVLYVSSDDDSPIVLYLREEGHENPALALTLIPRGIPPRELRLQVGQATLQQIRAETTTPAGQAAADRQTGYVDRIRDQFRTVAQGAIPSGFTMRQPGVSDPGVFCMDPSLRIATGEVLEGHDRLILVAQAQNISNLPVEVNEESCHQPGVQAVAAWPTPFVKPGMKIELFVARKRADTYVPGRERPSLIEAQ